MDIILVLQGLLLLTIIGLVVYLWRRNCLLSQHLQTQQQLMEQTFHKIHNGPLQLQSYLIRELQKREIPQQKLIDHLQSTYRDVQTDIEALRTPYSKLQVSTWTWFTRLIP